MMLSEAAVATSMESNGNVSIDVTDNGLVVRLE